FAIGRNSQPNPQKLVGIQGSKDGFHPVVPRRTAPLPYADRAQRQVELVVNRCPRGQRAALAIPDFNSKAVGDPIYRQEPEIVRRELVLDSRIAQTDDQFHADSLLALSYYWLLARSQQPAA